MLSILVMFMEVVFVMFAATMTIAFFGGIAWAVVCCITGKDFTEIAEKKLYGEDFMQY